MYQLFLDHSWPSKVVELQSHFALVGNMRSPKKTWWFSMIQISSCLGGILFNFKRKVSFSNGKKHLQKVVSAWKFELENHFHLLGSSLCCGLPGERGGTVSAGSLGVCRDKRGKRWWIIAGGVGCEMGPPIFFCEGWIKKASSKWFGTFFVVLWVGCYSNWSNPFFWGGNQKQ